MKKKSQNIGYWHMDKENLDEKSIFSKKTFCNILFSSQLTNGPNKPERYIKLGWDDLQ
jgi:hypothetical protein